jgi:dihydroorotate dehydrogenase (fumarate)
MANLATTYMGLPLANPVVVSSSGLTRTLDGVRRAAEAGAGAVVLKSIFEEEVEAAGRQSRGSGETFGYQDEAEAYLERYGREGAFEDYLQLIHQAREAVPVPVVASIHCITAGGWTDFAHRVQQAGADALELNVFALPTDPWRTGREYEELYFDVARTVTEKISIPVALKIGPYFSGLTRTLVELGRSGVAALVLFNRFLPLDFDIEAIEVVPGMSYSTPAEMHQTLRWISILSGRVACDLAAATGVHDAPAVIKQLLAGATTVQVCSTLYERGMPYVETLVRELEAWMERKGFETLDHFRGALTQKRVADPEAHERVQFMRATGVD